MLKDGLKKAPRGAEETHDEDLLPFAYEELDERFSTLLEDEELEEAFREFQVNAAWPG